MIMTTRQPMKSHPSWTVVAYYIAVIVGILVNGRYAQINIFPSASRTESTANVASTPILQQSLLPSDIHYSYIPNRILLRRFHTQTFIDQNKIGLSFARNLKPPIRTTVQYITIARWKIRKQALATACVSWHHARDSTTSSYQLVESTVILKRQINEGTACNTDSKNKRTGPPPLQLTPPYTLS